MIYNADFKMKKIIAAALIGIFIISAFTGCSGKTEKNAEEKKETEITNCLSVTEIMPYSGKYVEDGSDEEVENIVAAVLSNTTETDYELVEFSVTTDKGTHRFSASTVKAGSTTTVLCRDRDNFENNESMQSFSIDVNAEYVNPISLAEGVLEIYRTGKTVSLKNAGDKELNNIAVFYKQKNDIGYLGGITYKSTVNSLKPGEITQFHSEHLDEIVNIIYHE